MGNKYRHFGNEQRHVLENYLKDGMSLREISKKLNRSVSTLSYEIKENSRDGTRAEYKAGFANLQARLRKWSANSRNPLKEVSVWTFVLEKLKERWSPQQIAGRLQEIYPDENKRHVSHETIYRFINSREGKELGLHKYLRRRKLRKIHRPMDYFQAKREAIPGRVPISKRPRIVARKRRFGDWESDMMEGKRQSRGALTVQKERRSQYVCLTKIEDKSASETIRAMMQKFRRFPARVLRTVTFDNGRENSNHQELKRKFGMETYFCDPYCSWQKGSVENIIGLVRDYLPKGTDLNMVKNKQIEEIQNALNNRPRKCLGYMTPTEVLSKHLKKLGVRLPT